MALLSSCISFVVLLVIGFPIAFNLILSSIDHRPDMLLSPAAQPGQMEGNPIHLDMLKATGLLKI